MCYAARLIVYPVVDASVTRGVRSGATFLALGSLPCMSGSWERAVVMSGVDIPDNTAVCQLGGSVHTLLVVPADGCTTGHRVL